MKRIALALLILTVLLAGCSGKEDPVPSQARPQASMPPAAPESDSVPSEEILETAGFPAQDGDVVEISERLFIAQTNDIYINAEDYFGKTIRYEGIYTTSTWEEEDITYRYVIRYGPGCCGDDGMAGFEVAWDGAWPQEDDWCQVEGILEEYEINGWWYLRLNVTSLTVLDERGAEFVST